MATGSFSMETRLTVTDVAVATVAAAKTKSECHREMLQAMIGLEHAQPGDVITAQELYNWMENNKESLTEDQRVIWNRYSARCHMKYFISRYAKSGVSVVTEVLEAAVA
jgi:hypothetical protein